MLVHFLRNALDYLLRKADGDCRQELPWPYDRRDLKEAQQDLQAWLQLWEQRYPRLTDGVEPQEHRDHDTLDLVNGYRVRRNEAPAREPTRVPGRDLPAGDRASDPIVDLRVADSGTLGNMSMCGGAQLVVCPLNKLTLDLRDASTVRARIGVAAMISGCVRRSVLSGSA